MQHPSRGGHGHLGVREGSKASLNAMRSEDARRCLHHVSPRFSPRSHPGLCWRKGLLQGLGGALLHRLDAEPFICEKWPSSVLPKELLCPR